MSGHSRNARVIPDPARTTTCIGAAPVRTCRERCFKKDWVVDLDVKAFFDSVPWDLMLKAVQRHTDSKWVLLYVERWLKAPMLMPDGTLNARTKGTPQGGPVSPLLANLFLHYGFDMWMSREFPGITFERFADDAVIHCVTERQARQVRDAIGGRLADIGLELHPGKTKLVYCKDSRRRQEFDQVTFTFCGYAFRPRMAFDKNRKQIYTGFLPAVAPEKLTRTSAPLLRPPCAWTGSCCYLGFYQCEVALPGGDIGGGPGLDEDHYL